MLKYNDKEDLVKIGIAEIKDNVFLIKANYAAYCIMDELKYHIDALQKDQEALQEVISYIAEAVRNSDKTTQGNLEISPEFFKIESNLFRRAPLADISIFGLMNDKTNASLIQEEGIFKMRTDGQMQLLWRVEQTPQKSDPVPVFVSLTYEGTEGQLTKKLTAFDCAVYNAVATRFYYWKKENLQQPLYITPQEIWRTMNGKNSRDGKANPGKAQNEKICRSLDKMRYTGFTMDLREEIEKHKLYIDDERIQGGQINTYLLNCDKVTFTTEKGRTVTGYRISNEPILYTYNRAKNHIIYVPYEMLDTSKNIGDTENVTEFRNYLLLQIQLMKSAEDGSNRFKRNNIILLETIYRDTGIQTPEERAKTTAFTSDSARLTYIRKTRKADRQKIEGLLDAWTAKGWIKGYAVLNVNNEPVKEKQQAKGYRINI